MMLSQNSSLVFVFLTLSASLLPFNSYTELIIYFKDA